MNTNKQEEILQPDDMVFVLDIGTRSIIGLAGVVESEKLKVLAIEAADHTKRSMIDGQIEDISAVAKLAESVKEQVEAKLGVSLKRVCVAAAGRALKTERASFEMDVPGEKAIDEDLINQLESGAIEKIENALSEAAGDSYKQFYLVGYNTVQYYLDDYPISSLADHHGAKIRADILATFLPSEVVESLYTAMHQAGLEVASLTLEPIAAINAAIPENLRLLNLAFADIGAGTSDIAVCKDGNIVGYTMATIAGDEITEALMKEYLIDFDTAEQIKFELESKKEIYFTDIMGFEQTLNADDVLSSISGYTETLCKEIADKIVEVNGGPPSAVFLAGGGSKLRGVLEGVTRALDMDERRVALAGGNFKTTAFSKEFDLNNPEYATPLGIAVSTGLNLINDSYHLTLNGKRARLFRNGQLTVLNVLTMNGYRYRDLFGRSGSSLVVTVNGKRTVLYGKAATNSLLTLNGEPASANDLVKAGDVLEFIPAQPGENAAATVADVIENAAAMDVTVNGILSDPDTALKTGDVILSGPAVYEAPAAAASPAPAVSPQAAAPAEELPAANAAQAQENTVKDGQTQVPQTAPGAANGQAAANAQQTMQTAQTPANPGANAPVNAAPAAQPAQETPETGGQNRTSGNQTAGSRAAEHTAPARQNAARPAGKEIPVREIPAMNAPAQAAVNPQAASPSQDAFPEDEIIPQEEDADINSSSEEYLPRTQVWHFTLNDEPVTFPAKPDHSPYLLLDMLEYSGLDFDNLTAPVILAVNGLPGIFQQELRQNDTIIIKQDDER